MCLCGCEKEYKRPKLRCTCNEPRRFYTDRFGNERCRRCELISNDDPDFSMPPITVEYELVKEIEYRTNPLLIIVVGIVSCLIGVMI